jgi:probable HAF family extracellular repeat protein
MSRKTRFLALLLFLSSLLAPGSTAQAQTYKITNLGVPTGASSTSAWDINAAGLVIGTTSRLLRSNYEQTYYAFVWENGVFTSLVPAAGREYSLPAGVDDAGNVVGFSQNNTAGAVSIPTYWTRANRYAPRNPNTMLPPGSPWAVTGVGGISPNGDYVAARVTNAAIGYSGAAVLKLSPDRSQILLVAPLGGLGGRETDGSTGSAKSVNNSGQVTGIAYSGQIDGSGLPIYHGYRVSPQDTDGDGIPDSWFTADTAPGVDPFKNVLMQDLGTLGGLRSLPAFINGTGQIAGDSNTSSGARHPFLWMEGTLLDLGAIPGTSGGIANGLNDSRQVVGECSGKAFVWDSARGIRDLNLLKAAGDTSGMTLMSAYAVSPGGRIVGRGQAKGKASNRAFIAVPQP